MKLIISPKAEQDLEGIADYIAADNPISALSFIEQLASHGRKICHRPLIYRLRPELGNNIRCSVYGSYLVFYSTDEKHVRIERILYEARDLPGAFSE